MHNRQLAYFPVVITFETMPQLSLQAAELAGTLLESLLVGGYLVLLSGALYLMFTSRRGAVNRIVLSVSLLLFIAISLHWGISLSRAHDAFVTHAPQSNGTLLYLTNTQSWKMMASLITYGQCGFLMDILLTWRLYIIWSKKIHIVFLPALCVMTGEVCSAVQLHLISTSSIVAATHKSTSGKWAIASYSLSFFVNIYSTTLIIYRIISGNKSSSSGRAKSIFVVRLLEMRFALD